MMVTERKTTTLQSAGHTRWPHPLIIYFIDHCDASLNLLEWTVIPSILFNEKSVCSEL